MPTYNETGSGGSYCAGLISVNSSETRYVSGGARLQGIAVAPVTDFLEGLEIGSRCSGHTTTNFCCRVGDDHRTVNWLRIKDAYVPAITVCTQRLYS